MVTQFVVLLWFHPHMGQKLGLVIFFGKLGLANS
jgi:hypothetical protein